MLNILNNICLFAYFLLQFMNKSQLGLNKPIPNRNVAELKPVYRTIILDCQTQKAAPTCEYCIAYKTCKARKK